MTSKRNPEPESPATAHAFPAPATVSRTTSLPVREITDELRVEANHVYVITPTQASLSPKAC